MKIFAFIPEDSGVGWYRFWKPLSFLQERGDIEFRSWGFDFSGTRRQPPTVQEFADAAKWADVVVIGRWDIPQWKLYVDMVKSFTSAKVLMDIDDNIYAISPYMAVGQLYAPGSDTRKIHEDIIASVDGIIASTSGIKELYEPKKRTWIVPNGVEGQHTLNPHDPLRIGYLCSQSHLENAQIIEQSVVRILERHPSVQFYFTKAFQGFMEVVPESVKSRINFLPFFPLKEYLSYVHQLNLDIGLAPLMDNPFNRCKSNIRVLEYWQNGTVPIASAVGEYTRTIRDGYNGILVENDGDSWDSALDELIQNKERRQYLRGNGYQSLAGYSVEKSADAYCAALREVLA